MSSNRGNIYFEIQTNDPARAMGFCSEVFGWQFSAVKDLPIEYWRIAANRSEGGLLRRPAQNPAGPCGTNAFVCSFEVESYDLTERKILRLGGTVALPKFPVRGRCWQGYYIDTEGKTFGVFEVDEEAGN